MIRPLFFPENLDTNLQFQQHILLQQSAFLQTKSPSTKDKASSTASSLLLNSARLVNAVKFYTPTTTRTKGFSSLSYSLLRTVNQSGYLQLYYQVGGDSLRQVVLHSSSPRTKIPGLRWRRPQASITGLWSTRYYHTKKEEGEGKQNIKQSDTSHTQAGERGRIN